MGFLSKMLIATGVLVTYGKVIGGDYLGSDIACDGKRIIFHGQTKYCFTKDDVENYTVSDTTLAGAKITIYFKDGKKSLLKVDNKGVNAIEKILF